jgi:hypothetical protein
MSELAAAMFLAVPNTSTVAVVHAFWVEAQRPVSRAIWVKVF